MKLRTALITAGALALANCGGGGGGSANVSAACEAETNMSAEICNCIGKQAKQQLSGKGKAFVVASLKKEHEKAQKLTKSMDFDEVAEAGTFLVTASTSCALAQ